MTALEETYTLAAMRRRLVRGLDLASLPRLDWLVDGLVPSPGFVALYGPPKSGKSFLAIDLALSVATGRPWLGRKVRKGPVLYVVGEGQAGIIARQEAWSLYHGESDLDVYWHPRAVNLMLRPEVDAVEAIGKELQPSLIVFDTLARCMAGADENSEMGTVVSHVDQIREACGATVLVVHHSGKDASKGMRGDTKLLGAVDAVYKVTGSDGKARFEVEDAKDFASGHMVSLGAEHVGESLVMVEGAGGDPVMPARAAELLHALAESDTEAGLTAGEWRQLVDIPPSSFFRIRSFLERRGEIRNVGSDKRPRYRPTTGVQ